MNLWHGTPPFRSGERESRAEGALSGIVILILALAIFLLGIAYAKAANDRADAEIRLERELAR